MHPVASPITTFLLGPSVNRSELVGSGRPCPELWTQADEKHSQPHHLLGRQTEISALAQEHLVTNQEHLVQILLITPSNFKGL